MKLCCCVVTCTVTYLVMKAGESKNSLCLSSRFSRHQKEVGMAVLLQGTGVVCAPAVATKPLPPAKGLSFVQVRQGQPFDFNVPEEQPGPLSRGLPPPPPPTHPPPPPAPLLGSHIAPAPDAQPPPLPVPQQVPRSTAYRKRRAAEAAAAGQGPPPGRKNLLSHAAVHLQQVWPAEEDGHWPYRFAGVAYCAVAGGKTVEEWKEERRRRQAGDQEGK